MLGSGATRHLGHEVADVRTELAWVSSKRLQLQVERLCDVDPRVRLPRRAEPKLGYLVRFKAIGEELREGQPWTAGILSRVRKKMSRLQFQKALFQQP